MATPRRPGGLPRAAPYFHGAMVSVSAPVCAMMLGAYMSVTLAGGALYVPANCGGHRRLGHLGRPRGGL